MKFPPTGIVLLAAIFAVTMLNTPDTFAKKGGPDDFGYVYIDSNESPADDPDGASRCHTVFEDISGTGTPLNLLQNGEENITAPFVITIYDTTSAEIRVGNNGGLVLGTTTGDIYGINRTLPTTDHAFANGPGVAPFWDNLSDASGNVYTQTRGAAPDRKFIVQWENRPNHFVGGADTATFQVVFYENKSRIDFVYADTVFSNASYDYGASASIGINQNGSNALQYSSNEASLNTPSPVTAICFEKPTITLKVTAGTDLRIDGGSSTGAHCYTSETYTLHKGENAQLCYKIFNTSSFADLSHHWIASSEHGNLLNNYPFTLRPGGSVFLNEWNNNVDTGFTETATWSTEAAEDTSSATVNVVGFTCPADKPLTQKYLYNFEADNGGGIATNDWEWGAIPNFIPPEHSGDKIWATVLNGPYNNLNDHSLLTFELDLRKISAPVGLLWKQTLQAKNSGFDFATITVNGDIVYDSSGIPDESGWTLHYASLDDYAGNRVTLVFNFFATGVVNDEGWYIDDLTIEHCNEPTSNILKVLYYPILTGVTSE